MIQEEPNYQSKTGQDLQTDYQIQQLISQNETKIQYNRSTCDIIEENDQVEECKYQFGINKTVKNEYQSINCDCRKVFSQIQSENNNQIKDSNTFNNLMDFIHFNQVLNFLDIASLNKLANLNSRTRLRVKNHFLTQTFLKEIKCFEKEQKTILFETMLLHLKSKISFYYKSNQVQEEELYSLQVHTHQNQLQILFNDLKDQGVEGIENLSQVIPHIQKRGGIRVAFADIFTLTQCNYSSQPNQDTLTSEFTYCKTLSKELNLFLSILQEQRSIRSIFKFDEDEMKEKDMIKYIIRYLNWKGFERIRPSVVKRIETQKFKKQNNIYNYLTKNALCLILPFLSTREILYLKNSSRQLSQIVQLALEDHIQNLQKRKQDQLEKLEMTQPLLSQAELLASYYILKTLVQETYQIEVILISNLQVIVSILNYLCEENQKEIDLGQTYVWEYILEQTESVNAQFIEQFIPNKSQNNQNNSDTDSAQQNNQNTMEEEPAMFYYQDSEEYSILALQLQSLSYKLKRNLEIDPSFQKYLLNYLETFYGINKQIILLSKLQNKGVQVPPIYANSIFDNLIASYSFQFRTIEEEDNFFDLEADFQNNGEEQEDDYDNQGDDFQEDENEEQELEEDEQELEEDEQDGENSQGEDQQIESIQNINNEQEEDSQMDQN